MEKKLDVISTFILLLLVFIIVLTISFGYYYYVSTETSKYTEENGYYTYAIIFYPDMKKSVEGFVDEFNIKDGICRIILDGTEYTVDSKNVVFTKKKDEFLKKEVVNEKNRNDN